ncbi:MAG: thioredoxin family protein [Bacteroidales bacterium]|nr:thioredoxin family protein [Bacteroidales bacterium]
MKKLLFIVFVFIGINSFGQGIEFFHGTFAEAQAKAKAESKEIFMDFYTSWCAPCKVMAKKYFVLESVGKAFNKKFVCLKIDGEKGEGPKLVKKYGIKSYPTLVFIKENGVLIKKVQGLQNEQKLIQLTK